MNWISVKDRLPEDESWVLVYADGPYIADYIDGHWKSCNCNCKEGCSGPADYVPVTHWQPLPSPPKQMELEL